MEADNDAERAILAAYPHGGKVVLDGDESARTVRGEFLAALVTGTVDGLTNGGRPRLDLTNAIVAGTMDLQGADVGATITVTASTFDAPILLDDADIRALRLPGCTIQGIEANNVHVKGSIELNEGFTSHRKITLLGAKIGGDLRLTRSTLHATPAAEDPDSPKGVALMASRAVIGGGVLASGTEVHGQLRFISARVGSLLSLKGAKLHNPGTIAFQGERLEVGESFLLQADFVADGRVFLQNATIEGGLDAVDSTFGGAGDSRACLQLVRATVGRNVALTRAKIDGRVDLRSATVKGNVWFSDAEFTAGTGRILARRLTAVVLNLRWATGPTAVDLRFSKVAAIEDAKDTWPSTLKMTGCSYDVVDASPNVSVTDRLAWLRLDSDHYRPQPYEQLCAAYRSAGEEQSAKRVQLEKQRQRRATLSPPGQVLGYLQDAFVGYGYRAWLAAGWMALFAVLGAFVFHNNPPSPGKDAPAFNALVYSLDLLVPIVDLGQGDAYTAHGTGRWVAYLLIVIGWALTTAVAAGLTRLIARD